MTLLERTDHATYCPYKGALTIARTAHDLSRRLT
ncbi:hypothetical protein SB861_48605 [Paraburkholderia sp. SIMBA_049]